MKEITAVIISVCVAASLFTITTVAKPQVVEDRRYGVRIVNLLDEKIYFSVYWDDSPPRIYNHPITDELAVDLGPEYVAGGEVKAGGQLLVYSSMIPDSHYSVHVSVMDEYEGVHLPIGIKYIWTNPTMPDGTVIRYLLHNGVNRE